MNIIYLHGFQSSAQSVKGTLFQKSCNQHTDFKVHLLDLNMPVAQALDYIRTYIQGLEQVVLVGSSFGGFYATQILAEQALPCVLINPAMLPWLAFKKAFSSEDLPYRVHPNWQLDEAQLIYLQQISAPVVKAPHKVLVLLQQGDEVLDYREAYRYYSREQHAALVICETQGSHVMHNFAEKIPLMLQFLSDSLK